MIISNSGIRFIASLEGFRETAYQDVGGVWTIGYGETLGVKPGDRISPEDALLSLAKRLGQFSSEVDRILRILPTQNQFDAMTSFTYNVGTAAFSTSTLLRKFNSGDAPGAAEEFLRWDKVRGVPVLGLRRRRASEKELFLRPV